MKPLLAFMKKEVLEAARTGKLLIVTMLFGLFGIMNPAIAKLTPWMMEMLSDTIAETGLIVGEVHVDAMTSWTQFFKNIPMALIAFVLIFSDLFTKEYKAGTLLLVLTRGLSRYKMVLAKAVLLLSVWTLGYGLCFAVTYGYNACLWDNAIARHLFLSAAVWWLFGAWVICLMVLSSTLSHNNTGVCLCTGATVLLAYLLGLIPKLGAYSPAMLMGSSSLLTGAGSVEGYIKAIVLAAVSGVICIGAGVPVMNKKQL